MPVTVVRGSPDSRTRSDRVSGPEHSSSASSSPALPPGSYGIAALRLFRTIMTNPD